MDSSLRLKFFFVQALTLVRVPLIFLFLGVSVFCGYPLSELWFLVAFGAMILSAVTDLFDGYFARKFRVASRLGGYADPMMDKVFYLTTFPTLVYLADRIGQHWPCPGVARAGHPVSLARPVGHAFCAPSAPCTT